MINGIRSWYTWYNETTTSTQEFSLADILTPWAVLKTDTIERNEKNLELLERTKQAQIDVLKLKYNRKTFVNHYINI